ncbi:MAG: hypothetical protein NTV61_05500 [Candidatus Bathyarchaeota archaeon]|nr:hypothetical protein [Candidatus Bathyarchaeota archaeon]
MAKDVICIHVELTKGSSEALAEEWKLLWPNIPLYIIPSPIDP